ncbi:uncharacterized protein LOC119966628 isoform X2 [Scyliorhinus canicula]|uniref:uncharacterized protein LOC119966628 isoform X2 n=1 Tax=Scyliorhinus canicula TaxID=7830 RepID=UPI0018F6E031|nr:uncharacterized protein LOC119966628 isoform X2 [Scyliorhinus canicula]
MDNNDKAANQGAGPGDRARSGAGGNAPCDSNTSPDGTCPFPGAGGASGGACPFRRRASGGEPGSSHSARRQMADAENMFSSNAPIHITAGGQIADAANMFNAPIHITARGQIAEAENMFNAPIHITARGQCADAANMFNAPIHITARGQIAEQGSNMPINVVGGGQFGVPSRGGNGNDPFGNHTQDDSSTCYPPDTTYSEDTDDDETSEEDSTCETCPTFPTQDSDQSDSSDICETCPSTLDQKMFSSSFSDQDTCDMKTFSTAFSDEDTCATKDITTQDMSTDLSSHSFSGFLDSTIQETTESTFDELSAIDDSVFMDSTGSSLGPMHSTLDSEQTMDNTCSRTPGTDDTEGTDDSDETESTESSEEESTEDMTPTEESEPESSEDESDPTLDKINEMFPTNNRRTRHTSEVGRCAGRGAPNRRHSLPANTQFRAGGGTAPNPCGDRNCPHTPGTCGGRRDLERIDPNDVMAMLTFPPSDDLLEQYPIPQSSVCPIGHDILTPLQAPLVPQRVGPRTCPRGRGAGRGRGARRPMSDRLRRQIQEGAVAVSAEADRLLQSDMDAAMATAMRIEEEEQRHLAATGGCPCAQQGEAPPPPIPNWGPMTEVRRDLELIDPNDVMAMLTFPPSDDLLEQYPIPQSSVCPIGHDILTPLQAPLAPTKSHVCPRSAAPPPSNVCPRSAAAHPPPSNVCPRSAAAHPPPSNVCPRSAAPPPSNACPRGAAPPPDMRRQPRKRRASEISEKKSSCCQKPGRAAPPAYDLRHLDAAALDQSDWSHLGAAAPPIRSTRTTACPARRRRTQAAAPERQDTPCPRPNREPVTPKCKKRGPGGARLPTPPRPVPAETGRTLAQEDEMQRHVIGEIAFQLDRRILTFVFSTAPRLYGFRVMNIQDKIPQTASSPCEQHEMIQRENQVMQQLRNHGYCPHKHPKFSERVVNTFGILKEKPQCQAMLANYNNPEYLKRMIHQNAPLNMVPDLMVLLNSLANLATNDGKPLFIW